MGMERISAVDELMSREAPPSPAISERVAEPYLEEVRFRNQAVWANTGNWYFGFYIGRGDARLWVPRRLRSGEADGRRRVLNFGHPLGRRALRVLVAGYFVGTLLVGSVFGYGAALLAR